MMQNIVEHHRAGVARERLFPRHHLVEDRAQRKQIAARVELFAARLFRRHVRDRAYSGSRAGEQQSFRLNDGFAVAIRVIFRQQLGETEVENFDLPAVRRKNVRRLDVAMKDSFFVRGVERVRKLNPHFNRARHRKAAEPNHFVEGRPFEQFHGDEPQLTGFFDRVNGADAGVIQRGGRARFAQEAFQRLRITAGTFRQEFQRYAPAEFCVFGFIHHAHSAAPKFAENAIVTDGFVQHFSSAFQRMFLG